MQYIQYALSLTLEERRDTVSVDWAQLAQLVEQQPSCAKCGFGKLLLESLAGSSNDEAQQQSWGPQASQESQQQGDQERTDTAASPVCSSRSRAPHSNSRREWHVSDSGCGDLSMPTTQRLQQLCKSRTAYSLLHFCWPALLSASGTNSTEPATGARHVDALAQRQQQQQRFPDTDMHSEDTAQHADQQHQRHQTAVQQQHFHKQTIRDHMCMGDLPALALTSSILSNDEQLSAFLQDALHMAQQAAADGFGHSVKLDASCHSSAGAGPAIAGRASLRTVADDGAGTPGPAELRALAAKLQQQLSAVAKQLADAGYNPHSLHPTGECSLQSAQHRTRQQSLCKPNGQASRAAARQGTATATRTVNEHGESVTSAMAVGEDELLWETELAAVAAQEAADRLAEAGEQHRNVKDEDVLVVTASPARSRGHATSCEMQEQQLAVMPGPLTSITTAIHHGDGDSDQDRTPLPIQQLQSQYDKIQQRQARLMHAWEQGLRVGTTQLSQLTALCCWAGVVRCYHAHQAQTCWHALLTPHQCSSIPVSNVGSPSCQGSQHQVCKDLDKQQTATAPGLEPQGDGQQLMNTSRTQGQRYCTDAPSSMGCSTCIVCTNQTCAQERELLFEQAHESTRRIVQLSTEWEECYKQLEQMQQAYEHERAVANAAVAAQQAATQSLKELQQRLDWSEAQPAKLALASAEELAQLLLHLETRLNRARSAHMQAVANQEQLCPVCWERRKGLVFQCGHQTCETCADKLTACPICRVHISLRIKTF